MEPQPQSEPAKRGWTAPILSGVAILLAVTLLGVPGYIAGYYCKLTGDSYTIYYFPESPKNPVLRIFLAPARLAMKIAPPLGQIYWTQFVAAGAPYSDDAGLPHMRENIPP